MTDKQINSLKASIDTKWIPIYEGVVNSDPKNQLECQLCKDYDSGCDYKYVCNGCPIYKQTKKHGCKDTPYITWCEKPTKENTLKMLQFLITLLPKKEREHYKEYLIKECD
jgi:hypothetical protein